MKLIVVLICSVIATSLASPSKLDNVLNDLEVVLQDLKEEPTETTVMGELQKVSELQEVMNSLNGDKPVPAELMGDLQKAPDDDQSDESDDDTTAATEEILLHTDDIEATTAEIETAGGWVTMQLGHDLLIAQVPGDFVAKQKSFASATTHISGSASPATLSNAEAYWKYRGDKLKPQPIVQSWTEKTAPLSFPQEESLTVDEADSPYRQTMTGRIVIIVLAASGPGKLALSPSEFCLIKSEVLTGLDFWTRKAPRSARLSFVMYSGCASIRASDSYSCPRNNYATCHDRFANPTLNYFGYSSGKAGKDKLAANYKRIARADGAYLAFFSKFKQSHFAYAYFGGGPLYMQYSNDGWGPNQIDRVLAHETGHVFNAPDEYTNCQCYRNYGRGRCSARNNNCVGCTSRQSSCIMDKNDLNNICAHTKKHVGWC